MIPHTVPNRPMNGDTAPVDARKVMRFSTRSISRSIVTCMILSKRWDRLAPWIPPIKAIDDLRHSSIALMKMADIGSGGDDFFFKSP